MTEGDVNIKEIIGKQLTGFPSEFDDCAYLLLLNDTICRLELLHCTEIESS
jgi:hypothetical protein